MWPYKGWILHQRSPASCLNGTYTTGVIRGSLGSSQERKEKEKRRKRKMNGPKVKKKFCHDLCVVHLSDYGCG
jgi:hypothetical protein